MIILVLILTHPLFSLITISLSHFFTVTSSCDYLPSVNYSFSVNGSINIKSIFSFISVSPPLVLLIISPLWNFKTALSQMSIRSFPSSEARTSVLIPHQCPFHNHYTWIQYPNSVKSTWYIYLYITWCWPYQPSPADFVFPKIIFSSGEIYWWRRVYLSFFWGGGVSVNIWYSIPRNVGWIVGLFSKYLTYHNTEHIWMHRDKSCKFIF